jgi:hypothetical protein
MRTVRRVEVELLRQGPRHNQLLSPLTDYLAMCGDFPGGVVHVPWEHAEVLNLLDDLRYTVSTAEPTDRLAVVRERAGTQLATMLAMIPGLPGLLAGDTSDTGKLTHLRLVVSAAELAVLPFELAKVPVGAGSVGDQWLGLQPDRPVCITRHVRGATASSRWADTPRILVVSGDDVPFAEHLDAFGRVLEPWSTDELRPHPDSPRHWTSEHLTVIDRATLDEIRTAVATRNHTHVHVLAHGAELEGRRSVRHGIALGDRVVTGSELALALAPTSADRHLPTVVTLASCDSAAQGAVITPGGSVAHDLHAAGIPLVIASQFPISQAASVPFTEGFYRGQLAGEHPLVSISEVRRVLATQFGDEHAWASIVVYEALPNDFEARLEEIRYWQTRRAHETALTRLERLATSDSERAAQLMASGAPFASDFSSPTVDEHRHLLSAAARAAQELPTAGPFAAECDGLRAAGAKRSAEVAFWLAEAPDVAAERRHELLEACVGDLEVALEHYVDGLRGLLATSTGEPQRKVTTHWIAGQVMLMQAILGRPIDPDLGGIARWTARLDLDHPDPVVRAWAITSHIEQTLLELAVGEPTNEVSERAVRHARDLVRAIGEDSEHAMTTHRQMRRFVEWWGGDRFVAALHELGIDRSVPWTDEYGVVATARAVADVLIAPRRTGRSRRTPSARLLASASVSPTATAASLFGSAPGTTTRSRAPEGRLSAARPADEQRAGTFEIEMLPAANGDCLWITYGAPDDLHYVLVDCGAPAAAQLAAERVRAVPSVELFVLTHIDADHISGAIPLFADRDVAEQFEEVWFNGWNQLRGFLSVSQGDAFSDLLDRDDRPFRWNGCAPGDDRPPPIVTDGEDHPEVELAGGLRLTVLSPTNSGLQRLARHWYAALAELDPRRQLLAGRRSRPTPPTNPSGLNLVEMAASGPTKDTSVPNLSSIAVLAEFGGRAVLLTGDAHADVLAASIRTLQRHRGRDGERLRLDALKLSHHGSANATTVDLLDAVECAHYLVPTDGSIFYHPDREAMARVIVHGGRNSTNTAPTLHFNHRTDLNGFWSDAALQQRYGYATAYPEGDAGLRIVL